MAADHDEDEDVDVNLSEVSKFCKFNELHLVSDNEIFQSWDRMSDRFSRVSDKEFRLWEQASGISYSKFALLANDELRSVLRPTQQNCWDWMHCLLSSGVMNLACYNLCQEIKQWDLLKSYVQLFQLPSHLGNIRLAPLFDEKRIAKHKKHKKINATASELLTLVSILAHYVRVVCIPANVCQQEVAVFLAICEMLDLLQSTWHGIVEPKQLLLTAERILQLWKDLKWPFIKKHHWLLHLHQMMQYHHCIPSCFAMERKNKVPARVATTIQNLQAFEHSLYSEIITLEMERVADPEAFAFGPALLQSKKLSKKLLPLASQVFSQLHDVQASNHARIKYGSCSRGDIVYLSSKSGNRFDAGEILAFLSNATNDVCIINCFTLEKMCETFAEWQDDENLEVVPLAQLWIAVTFAKGTNKAEAVAETLERIINAGYPPNQIVVLTAYLAQKQELRRAIENRGLGQYLSSCHVDTIDGYQGMEQGLVLFSATRSNESNALGFLADNRRMNVMLTRAKQGLIVFGNAETLRNSASVESKWPAWLSWIEERNASVSNDQLSSLWQQATTRRPETQRQADVEPSKPTGAAPTPPPTPPTVWQQVYSAEHKAYYYWNQETNLTQWEEPPSFKPAP
ncbi:Helicase sen1 [Durusdinium trenchii]|uniref:Helicase sen1 n=1 Tax=Durusdinium trenchii TaxID=1381693 RepID=A0ABP0PIK8_9DINO